MVEDKIMLLVRTFGSIPKKVLIKYLVATAGITEGKADFILITLDQNGRLYHNRSDDWIYRYQGAEKNYSAAFVLDVIMILGGGNELRLAKAAYPYDYIFEADHTLYQVIDCYDEAIYKLNFKKKMREEKRADDDDVVPVLLMRDMPVSRIDRKLYPEGSFFFATASFDIRDLTTIRTELIPEEGDDGDE